MGLLAVVCGVLVLAALAVDVVATAVASGMPGGWLTRGVGSRAWKALNRMARPHHRMIQVAGLFLVMGLLLTWVTLLVVGWWLVLIGSGGVENASTGQPASVWQTLYFTGFTVSTLGLGDFIPGTGPGQAVTAIASTSGILVLTLSITYLVPVLGGVASKRELAQTLHAIGTTPETMAERLFPGPSLDTNRDVLMDLAGTIRDMTQMHYSYPVLHYFHSHRLRTAMPPALARLDETVTAVRAIRPDADDDLGIHLVRSAINDLLQALSSTFITVNDPAPPAPPLAVGSHLLDGEPPAGGEREARIQRQDDHRMRLCAFVQNDGWSWDDVLDGGGSEPGGRAS